MTNIVTVEAIMKIAIVMIAIVAGLSGLMFGSCAVFGGAVVSSLGEEFGTEEDVAMGDTVMDLGGAAFVLSIVGMIAAAFVERKQKATGVVLILCGILGFVAISVLWAMPGALFIIAGILAFTMKPNTAVAVEQ